MRHALLVAIVLLTAGCAEPSDPPHEDGTSSGPLADRTGTIIMVHGLNSQGETAEHHAAEWAPLIDGLAEGGWQRSMMPWFAYYECDAPRTLDAIEGIGDDPHGHHLPRGDRSTEHAGVGCGAIDGHNADTSVEHLGYHLAWTLERWRSDCPSLLVHSMGGLIARYALTQVAAGHDEFPEGLCVRRVVTMGTPATGSDLANQPVCTRYQCEQLRDGSDLLRWLGAHPGPARAGATEWIAIASEEDTIVHAPSQLGLGWDRAIMVRSAGAPFLHHGMYYHDNATTWDASWIVADAEGVRTVVDAPHVVTTVDRLLAGLPVPWEGVADGGPTIDWTDPPAGPVALGPDGTVEVEVECSPDPEGDRVYAVFFDDGVAVETDIDLFGTSPSHVFHDVAAGDGLAVRCQDGFVGETLTWTVTA